jgi:hypothetical protein
VTPRAFASVGVFETAAENKTFRILSSGYEKVLRSIVVLQCLDTTMQRGQSLGIGIFSSIVGMTACMGVWQVCSCAFYCGGSLKIGA